VIYDNLIEEIDGVDNGVSCFPSNLTPAYRVTTQLGHRVGRLNPKWNEPNQDARAGFDRAMELVGSEFSEVVDYYGTCWLPARGIVAAAIARRTEVDPSGAIVVLEGHVPWKEHLFDLEVSKPAIPNTRCLLISSYYPCTFLYCFLAPSLNCPSPHPKLQAEAGAQILFMLYPGEGGSWRVQCVPVRADSFESRRPLPEPLRGLRDEALSAAVGLPGGIFVHAGTTTPPSPSPASPWPAPLETPHPQVLHLLVAATPLRQFLPSGDRQNQRP
jgi:uncharacterized UPF0160 family protein